MPSVAFNSRIRTATESCTLTVVVEHRLLVGEPSHSVFKLKYPPPGELDIFLASNLFITVSGSVNATEIPSKEIQDSHIARHLADYLCMNADELGIIAVPSGGHIAEDTGLLTLVYAGCRPPSEAKLRADLIGFNIRYVWQTKDKQSVDNLSEETEQGSAMNPFSPHLPLPYLTMVNDTVARFMTYQVVKRYPLIFGQWCKQLDIETPFSSSIYASIRSIMNRSPNSDFVHKCKKLLKRSQYKIESSRRATLESVSDWIGTADILSDFLCVSGIKMSFISAMDQIYRLGMRRPRFRGLSAVCNSNDTEDGLFDSAACYAGADGDASKDCIQQNETSSSKRLFCALDIHDEHALSDFDLFSDCETDLECQSDLVPLAVASLSWSTVHDVVWLSDSDSALSDDEGLCDFPEEFHYSGLEEDRSQLSPSEESTEEDSLHDAALVLSFQCDWSPDIDASQEKVFRYSMGMGLSPDIPSFPEVDLSTLGAIPEHNIYVDPAQNENHVEEDLLDDSLFDHFAGSELTDDHGALNFEDEQPALSITSGKEEHENRDAISSKNSQVVEDYFVESFERPVALPDRCDAAMDWQFLRKGSHSIHQLGINDVQGILIMDFD